MMKRFLSAILSLAMILTMFSGLAFTASAANVNTGFDPASPGTFEKVTDVSTLADGDEILIVDETALMTISTTQNNNNRSAVGVTIISDTITVAEGNTAIQSFKLEADEAGFYLLAGEGLYLFAPNAYSGSSNYLRTTDAKGSAHAWTLTASAVTAANYTARGILHYNANNGNPIFSCYSSAGAVAIYKFNPNAGEQCTHENATYEDDPAPSCTEGGIRNWTCPDCNATWTEPLDALGHDWGEGVPNPAATCTEGGKLVYTCSRCGETKEENVLPLGHIDENEDGVCDRCGEAMPETLYYVLVDSGEDLFPSGEYLIVYEAGSLAFDGSLTTLDAVRNTQPVTIEETEDEDENAISVIEATTAMRAISFTYNKTAGTLKSASGYYIGRTASSNGLDASQETAYTVTIAHEQADDTNLDTVLITAQGGRTLLYNKTSGQERFRFLGSGQSISLYRLIEPSDGKVDLYVVDDTGYAGDMFCYAYGTAAEAGWPGSLMTKVGTDVDGHTYYHYRVDPNQFGSFVIFNRGNGQPQTANIEDYVARVGDKEYAIYHITGVSGNNLSIDAQEKEDIWPNTPVSTTDATCTEPATATYEGILTGARITRQTGNALGHDWGAWTHDEGHNTHSRTCARCSEKETEDCTFDENDICTVCGGEKIVFTALVESGEYVIAAKVGDDYYALPVEFDYNTPTGAVIEVVDGKVTSNAANGYRYHLTFLENDGTYAIDNGSVRLGHESGTAILHAQTLDEPLTENYKWTIENAESEFGTYKIANVVTTTRGIVYRNNSLTAGEGETIYNRFGAYMLSNINGADYFAIELLPIIPRTVKVYYVDDADLGVANYYTFNNPDNGVNNGWPGVALPDALGTDVNGKNVFMVEINADQFNSVIFNNGNGGQTPDLHFLADAGENDYIIYHGTASENNTLDDVEKLIDHQDPTCTVPGFDKFESFVTGEVREVPIPVIDHTPAEPVVENNNPATCTEGGSYESVIYCSACGAEISRELVTVDPLGHDWGEPSYEWTETETGWSCTASAVCERDEDHSVTETVEADYSVVTEPAVGVAGLAKYTAAFENELFTTQEKPVELPALEARLENGYYIIGTMNGWSVDNMTAEHLFARNTVSAAEEYLLRIELAVGDEFKVVYVENDAIRNNYYYPSEANYTVDAAHAGYNAIYFRPNYDGDSDPSHGWFYKCLYLTASLHFNILNTLSLDGDTSLNYYIAKSEMTAVLEQYNLALSDIKFIVVRDGDADPHELTPADNGNYYVYTFPGIPAKQLNDRMAAHVEFASNGNTISSAEHVYNPISYCYQVGKGNNRLTLRKACADLIQYAAAAQTYFDHNTDNMPNTEAAGWDDTMEGLVTQNDITTPNNSSKGTNGDVLNISTMTLGLDGRVAMNVKMSAPSGTLPNKNGFKLHYVYEDYKGNTQQGDILSSAWSQGTDNTYGSVYVAIFDKQSAGEMFKQVTFTVIQTVDGVDTVVSNEYVVSKADYAGNVFNYAGSSSVAAKMAPLMHKMLNYGQSVYNYQRDKAGLTY